WEREVLAHCEAAAQCAEEIRRRQQELDADQEEAELVRTGFRAVLRKAGCDPDKGKVWIPSLLVSLIYQEATGEKMGAAKVTSLLKTLAIPELAYKRLNRGPGWLWTGAAAAAATAVQYLNRDDSGKWGLSKC